MKTLYSKMTNLIGYLYYIYHSSQSSHSPGHPQLHFFKFTHVAMDVAMDIAKNIRPMQPHNKDCCHGPYCGAA